MGQYTGTSPNPSAGSTHQGRGADQLYVLFICLVVLPTPGHDPFDNMIHITIDTPNITLTCLATW
jgi:hypothetical protein